MRCGPGSSGTRALTTRSLADSRPTWSGTTKSVGTPAEGVYRGREGVLELSRAIRDSFGVARVEIEDVRDLSATEVLTLGTMHLEGRGSGAAVTTPFGAVTEILDGLAVRQQFWTDQSKALEAAGLRE